MLQYLLNLTLSLLIKFLLIPLLHILLNFPTLLLLYLFLHHLLIHLNQLSRSPSFTSSLGYRVTLPPPRSTLRLPCRLVSLALPPSLINLTLLRNLSIPLGFGILLLFSLDSRLLTKSVHLPAGS